MSGFTLNSTLTTLSFYILLAVADRSLHGYGILDQIAQDSQGQLIIATGTLYSALKRMTNSGLLERLEPIAGAPTTSTASLHRYRITARGREQLATETTRLRRVVTHADHKLGRRPTAPA